MYKKLCILLICMSMLSSCKENQSITQASDQTTQVFGDSIHNSQVTPIADALLALKEKGTQTLTLQSVAVDVCQKKGCWMTVQTVDSSEMRVTFKDYGFFMPKDISGKKVLMEGVLTYDTTSVEDLKHYAEDEGKTQAEIDLITEPAYEPTFEATGVKIIQ